MNDRAGRRTAIAVAALTILLCAPFFRYASWLGDEGILLNAAIRMTRGEALYRDFFEFIFPMPFVLTTWWMRIFGSSLAAERVLTIALVTLIAVLTYFACLSTSRAPRLSAFLAIAWVLC